MNMHVERDDLPVPLIVCFLHDHLKEVTRLQCKVIESTLLGDEFVSAETVKELRASAAVYLSYAEKIERLTRLVPTKHRPS